MSNTLRVPQRRWIALVPFLALVLVLASCASTAKSPPPSPTSAPAPVSSWSARPDAQGHYYAGNPTARVVIEEWSDYQ
ncbi:MAG: hypothetical protein M0T85_06750 [Dehalococcoidales bacterium]|nr:hypothetical protein [Dehalococcoidales bacterium]